MVVGEESEPFVREGRNAFAKFVTAADDGSAPVTRCSSSTTRTRCSRSDGPELSGAEAEHFASGVAVKVRNGAGSEGRRRKRYRRVVRPQHF